MNIQQVKFHLHLHNDNCYKNAKNTAKVSSFLFTAMFMIVVIGLFTSGLPADKTTKWVTCFYFCATAFAAIVYIIRSYILGKRRKELEVVIDLMVHQPESELIASTNNIRKQIGKIY